MYPKLHQVAYDKTSGVKNSTHVEENYWLPIPPPSLPPPLLWIEVVG